MDSFLKMPAIKEKQDKIAAMGLEKDHMKYPHVLPKDDDLADYEMYRTEANDAYDTMEKESLVYTNKQGETTTIAHEFKKVMDDHLKRNKKHQRKGLDYVNPNHLRKELDKLEWAFD